MQAVRATGQPRVADPARAVEYYRDSVASPSQPSASAQKKDVSLYQFFSPGGVLSRNHPAYEFRRGQLQMAQAVEQALGEKRHLIVEAGTGTGKTLAYLVPGIRSGKRVIIISGTKNLQEQLFYKVIPFLEHALFPDGEGKLSVCYMKGAIIIFAEKNSTILLIRRSSAAWMRSSITARLPHGRRPRRTATGLNWRRCPKPARFGTSSTLAPTPVSARNAARGIDVLSPKCTAGRWRATSSSSITIYFLRTWRSSSKPKTRMMQASCPTRAR